MLRLGLALSGGGFRATLYHLGVVRYLRDAGLLPLVSHITSVSGGSVLAAHLALNWDRYTGAAEQFDEAASEMLDFIRLDVRNRIIRRCPFAWIGGLANRWSQGRARRSCTRTGLLEGHYRRYLYGDTCLFQLPSYPELHILATNLSEGGLSSFSRGGLLIEERSKSHRMSMRYHRAGLATVPLAVAASSAFPGFFAPLELSAHELGTSQGEFPTQYFTDGGVYDNLGVRMFRYLERRQKVRLGPADFLDLEQALTLWNQAVRSEENTPLRRLARISALTRSGPDAAPALFQEPTRLLEELDALLVETDLDADQGLSELLGRIGRTDDGRGQSHNPGVGNGHAAGPENGNGNASGNGNGRGRGHAGAADAEDRTRRNRLLLSVAFNRTAGEACMRPVGQGFDAVIASDAGKKFQVSRPDRAGGFLRTAMRSSDILMDRVWQLERDYFADSTGYLFAPITRVVQLEEDATAMHPEVQVQVSHIRTDMDRFDDREMSGLIRHGYCVARQAVSERPCLADYRHDGGPWDPVVKATMFNTPRLQPRTWRGAAPSNAAVQARILQQSSRRGIGALLRAPHDWVWYLYAPLLVLLLAGSWMGYRFYQHAHMNSVLTSAIAETQPDFKQLLRLMEVGPIEPWTPMEFVETEQPGLLLGELGLDIISDTRITDLRRWAPAASQSHHASHRLYMYRLVSVRKTEHADGEAVLVLPAQWDGPGLIMRCHNSELKPELRRRKITAPDTRPDRHAWELKLDFREVPVGRTIRVAVEAMAPDDFAYDAESREWWRFEIDANPEVATAWILLPRDATRAPSRLIRYENSQPEHPELVEPTHQAVIRDGSVLNWTVVHPRAGYTYVSRWN